MKVIDFVQVLDKRANESQTTTTTTAAHGDAWTIIKSTAPDGGKRIEADDPPESIKPLDRLSLVTFAVIVLAGWAIVCGVVFVLFMQLTK